MVIRTNVAALRTYREGVKNARAMAKNLEKLSSGYRINRSADDASGLAVSERMRANITELGRCYSNAMEGLDIAKTADGALAEINDMLRRARGLCIQAENGTYSEQELASISDEINQLFSEVDRITASSTFNEIRLFRGDLGPDFHYEYDETFTPLEGDDPVAWGEMDFVQSSKFDDPPKAEAATATFKLDDGVDFNDVSSLNGRTIQVGSYTYYFTDGTVNPPSGYYSYPINLNTYSTTESALREFARQAADYSGPSSILIDKDTRTVTFNARLHAKNDGSFVATVDGKPVTVPNNDSQGNGSWANGTTAAQNVSGTPSLEQVDGQGATNNHVTYSNTATASFSLAGVHDSLNESDVKNLNGNKLNIGSRVIELKNLSPSNGMSRDAFGTKLAAAISNLGNDYDATYDSAEKRVKITLKNQPATSGSAGSISETTTRKETHDEPTLMFTSSGLSLGITVTSPASAESPEVCKITVPSSPSVPFSLYINGRRYMYYDSSVNNLRGADDDGTMYDGSKYSSPSIIDTRGRDRAWIINDIANRICPSSRGTFSISGDTITATSNSLNGSMGLSSSPTTVKVEGYKTVTDSEGTSPVIGAGAAFYKTATVPFSIGAEADISKLAGSGFSIDNGKWEFANGAGIHGEYGDIDISGCTTFDQLKDKVQQVMGNTYSVEIDKTDPNDAKLLISKPVTSNVTVKDGVAGIKNLISGSEPVKYSGGNDIGYSETKIDFSSISSDNLNDLLGKGFRINCATCSGEYINVFFCWENDGKVPEDFKIIDPDSGKERTIPNIAVELSKVTSGDQIVQSIVDQVRPNLKHFTDVDVGSPATTLVARDKRLGGAKENNQFKPAEVVTGLNTNFTYSVNIRKVEDYPADGSVVAKDNIVEIYVGSEPGPQIIPIHLPYLDLKTLRLSPPEVVDLNAMDQDAAEWLNRVDQANLYISKSRGVIGADHNRLEHAAQSLSHSKENLTDAESRIRDTDMAEEMMEHVKLQILTQAQQGMLAQACSQPQQVLKLIS